MWAAILFAIVGIWLILRTVRPDAQGKTLVDRVLGQ
jgi:hypothetical protein